MLFIYNVPHAEREREKKRETEREKERERVGERGEMNCKFIRKTRLYLYLYIYEPTPMALILTGISQPYSFEKY